jgi:hypothetical protein
MTTNDNQISQISRTNYSCIKCSYNTVRKNDYNKHILTAKHIKTTNNNNNSQNSHNRYNCAICNKHHNDRAGLWRHNQKCKDNPGSKSDSGDKDALIITLVKQNTELIKETSEVKTMMLEMLKKGTHHTTNTNNNTFNLNFFLNETCKDAMNLEDFINSIVWKIADLKMVGDMGYVKGFSKLISDKLKLIAEDKRPIHCTDAKREVMYVKDDNKWEKEPETKPKLHRAVKQASRPQLVLPVLTEFRELNPEYKVCESNVSTEYQMIITEALCGGEGENDVESVIKNISKNVVINKA